MPIKKKTEITVTETSQLSVFDYSQLSEQQIRKSLEIKGQMISVGKRVSDDLLYLAKLAKEQHDNLNSYPLFIDWCSKEMGYSPTMARRFLRVGKIEQPYTALKKLPDSLNGLDAIASALLKADSEEEKEEITQAINEATEEKGKALTEKEIKELIANQLGKVKQILNNPREAVKHTNEDLADQFSLPLAIVIEARENIELKRGEEILKGDRTFLDNKVQNLTAELAVSLTEKDRFKLTLENQDKKINDLNSLDSELKQRQKELDDKETSLNERTANFNQEVDKEAEKKLEKEKAIALAEVEEEKKKLTKEQQKIKQKLDAVTREKERFTRANKWVELMTEYNLEFAKMCDRLKYISTELNQVPKFEDLGELNEQMQKSAQLQMNKFSDNLDEFGKFNNRIIMGISRIDKNPLKAYEVTAEVIND